jgi:hypothetical protein
MKTSIRIKKLKRPEMNCLFKITLQFIFFNKTISSLFKFEAVTDPINQTFKLPESVLDKPIFKFSTSPTNNLDESSDENNISDTPNQLSSRH